MKCFILFLYLGIGVAACDSPHSTKGGQVDPDLQVDTSIYKGASVLDTSVKSISRLSDTLTLALQMDQSSSEITIPLNITTGTELLASLSSEDKKANIRISQVGLPDSTFDGPFGRDLHYKMKTPGRYQLKIGENKMAGDPWKGTFELRVWVK